VRRRDLSTALIATTVGAAALLPRRANSQSQDSPYYPRTEAEVASGATPMNYREPPGNPRRYGAAGDGKTPDRKALAVQDSIGEQIYLARGKYLVDSNLTLSAAVWCEQRAVFRVPDGVTLSFTGPFDGTKSQHFELEGTGTVQFGAAANRWPDEAVVPVCPEYWGAVNARAGDSTAAVQGCVNCHRDVRFYQDYSVSQIVLTGNELYIDFAGFSLIGNARVATSSVLDIKCGYSTLRDVKVDAGFNPLYQCAVHWYTNNLNLHNPCFNRIYGLWPRNALLGLCMGALPGQPLPIPRQGSVVAAGVATDAPLSESTIFGFQSTSCVRSLWMSQPNGKMQMVGATIIGSHAGWSSYGKSDYTSASTCALTIDNAPGQFSELHLSGGSIEENSEPSGLFIRLRNAHLYCAGTIMEAVCSSYFSGEVGVTLRDCMNFGFNFPIPYPPFLVAPACVGWLNISGGNLNFPSGHAAKGTVPLVKGAASIAGGLAVNYGHFVVRLDHVELEDIPFRGAPDYVPLCQGVAYTASHCLLTSYSPGFAPSRLRLVHLNDAADSLLSGKVDVSNYAVTGFAANGNGNSGGWKFTATDTTLCKWGSEASGIGVEGRALTNALRLSSGPVGADYAASATSPAVDLNPEHTCQIRGWIKCASQAGGRVRIRLANFRFDGAASAISAYSDLISLSDRQLTPDFQQLAAYAIVPADTTRVQLEISAVDGADVSLCGLELG
jgi:hypothetical protein